MSGPCPERPTIDQPGRVGFHRRGMVHWFAPRELALAALRVGLSSVFGTYADKREVQAVLGTPGVIDLSDRDELWFDYVADTGDGFDAAYTVARYLAAGELTLAPVDAPQEPSPAPDPAVGSNPAPRPPGAVSTPRGSVLVMGGDQVYPTASAGEYRDRLVGPYRAALPCTVGASPLLLAVPGNHDWYDGLTAFLRVFCRQQWIGGWRTRQARSYFAVKLPHRWWLWGIDIQFDTYIDEPQLAFFRDLVAPQMNPGDQVVLCSAKPNWVESNEEDAEAFATLDYFERKIVREHCRAELRLSLTGDSHHYARYQDPASGAQKITAGGGGAYLSATHHLPDDLLLPPPASTDQGRTSPPVSWTLERAYPDQDTSRRLRRGVWRLPVLNPTFTGLVGLVHVLLAWTVQSANREGFRDLDDAVQALSYWDALTALARHPLSVAFGVVLVAGLAGFTKARRPLVRWAVGLAHGGAHLALAAAVTWLVGDALWFVDGLAFTLAFVVLVAAVGGFLGAWLMALYLRLADQGGMNTNELFAAQRIDDHKSFLRLHLGADGALVVYPIAIDRVGRSWRLGHADEPTAPWYEPAVRPSPPRLIEGPVRIPPRRAASS